MWLRRFIEKLFSVDSGSGPDRYKQRYDDIKVVKIEDGTVIEGHDAVKAHFEREKQLNEAHGSSIIFQVYRMNLSANTLKELQGEMLAEIKVDGGFVSGKATVAAVKKKVRLLLEREVRLSREKGTQPGFHIEAKDRITLFFSGRPMQDVKLFYADHFMLLPVWVQVFLHDCEFGKVAELVAKLGKSESAESGAR